MWNCVYGKERGKKATVWTLLFCLFISCALTGCAGKEQKEELKEADATPTGEEILSGKDLVTDGEGTGEGSHSNGQLESEKGGNSFGSQSGLEGSGLDETPTYGDSIQSSSEGEIFPESTIVPPSKTEWEEFEIEGDTLVLYRGSAQDVIVPSGVKVIGKKAFFNKSDLLSVVLPQGVTIIEDAAFNGCGKLTKVVVPESLQSIGDRAFSGCQALKTIDFKNILYIGSYAFYKCYALTLATLTEVESLGTGAFWEAGLEKVSGLEKLEKIGDMAFKDTPFWEDYWDADGDSFFICNHILVLASKSSSRLEIPEGVQVIAPGAFRGISTQILVIPESVQEIQAGAFEGSSLKTVYAPDHDIEIGASAFDWNDLKSMKVLPLSAELDEKSNPDFLIIGNTLLSYRGKEQHVIVPEGVKVIGEGVFEEKNDMISVHLPKGLTTIRQNAFSGCINLSAVFLPDSVRSIWYRAFYECIALKDINLDSVEEIDEDAFRGCRQLESVNLVSARIIGRQAFLYSGIRQVDGMGCLTVFGYNVFGDTPFSKVKTDGMWIVGNVLIDGKSCAGDLEIPEGIEIIVEKAFEGSAVTKVKCPGSLKTIGMGAFSSCTDLEQFSMGDQVVFLGEQVFLGDINLSDIRLSKNLKEVPETAFVECENLRMLTIPKGCSVSRLSFYRSNDFAAKKQERLLTLPPTVMVPEFLKDFDSGNYRVYTTKLLPDSAWERAAREYGFRISLLELAVERVILREGEEFRLIFNSGAKADWYSQDETVVLVDENGVLCAKRAGETEVIGVIYGEEYRCRVVVE